jgi:FkbH-like protein
MKQFVFRNHTIEPFFEAAETTFSGYENIVAIEDAERYVWMYLPSCKTNEDVLSQEITSYIDLLKIAVSQIKPDKMFLVFTMQLLYKVNFQTSGHLIEEAIENYNHAAYDLAEQHPNIKVLNISDFYSKIDPTNAIDWKFYYISQMPLNPKLASPFKKWFANQLDAIAFKRKKCLVLDLDNTLWGGILGEDGVNGIKLDETYPGNCYLDFQRFLLDLSAKGIILTVCSKNNEQDVLEAWNQHPNMLLKKEHFAAWRINWNNKADNIKEIAKELNIGLDSLVFVDDNPTERELVTQTLPMVEVPDFPAHPYLYPKMVQNLVDEYFRTYSLTKEDILKLQQYKDNAARTQFKNASVNYEDYLKSLEIELTIKQLSDSNIARFAQMTQKTNQFNLTTKRYTESDLSALKSEGALLYGIRVSDRFGDNGLTGLLIAKIAGQYAAIDTLLLSCRILGKKIEYEFVNYAINQLKKSGITLLSATYIPTSKNAQVANFYDDLGFELSAASTEEQKEYSLDLSSFNYTQSKIFKINEI